MLKAKQKSKGQSESIQVSDDAPEKDTQLFLELEMDDEVKEIINFPEKYTDTYLDVTVIKPKSNQNCTTEKKIMSGEQVKKLIAAMNLGKHQGLNVNVSANELEQHQKSAGDYIPDLIKPKLSTHNPIEDGLKILPSSDSEVEQNKVQQVYTTTKPFNNLGAIFECKKSKRFPNEKLNSPCLCNNCAIVGIVNDSQKKPFATEPIKDPLELLNPKKFAIEESNKKKKVCKVGDHQQCQQYFKHLSDKIKVLEERISSQEQKAVPKDYFKKIISKLINHISKVTGQVKIETSVQPTTSKKCKYPSTARYDHIPLQRFIVNPVSIQNEKLLKEKIPQQETLSSNNTSMWKWGEDILKPGIDFKNKLIASMEDTLNNFKKSKEKPKEEELKHFINEFSNTLYKTINDGIKTEKSNRLDLTATIDFNEKKNKVRNLKRMGINLDDPVSVTYVNSHVLKWQDTQTTFKFESDKESVQNILDKKRTQEIHKLEFIKTIKNTKEDDKQRLWQSIWNQASKNGHNKNNKVTIQIPDKRNPKNQLVEVEYTLGDLEYLLLGSKLGRK